MNIRPHQRLADRGIDRDPVLAMRVLRPKLALRGIQDPTEIQRQAENEIPSEQLISEWPLGTDPAVHVDAIAKPFDSGVTIVNIHSGQSDQKKVIEFYASNVLPRLRQSG